MIRYGYAGEGVEDIARRARAYDSGFLRELFRRMLRIRMIEEEIERRYHEDRMKTPIHLVIGQEAASVGCCAALTDDDLVYSGHRTHGAYLAKGGDLTAMLCELFCRANGCAGSRGGSMHLIDKKVGMAGTSAIVGGAVPIASGAALAAQMQKLQRVTVVFMGDATTEEGVTSESLNFAALRRLPVIFFCENNFYSVQSPLATRQPPRSLQRWAEGFGVTSVEADGMNVLTVYETVVAAVTRARKGEGPTFIEAPVYRFRAHGGAGDDSQTGYRSVEERVAWESVCPVAMFRSYLLDAGLLSDAELERVRSMIQDEIAECFTIADTSPNPVEADLYLRVYAD